MLMNTGVLIIMGIRIVFRVFRVGLRLHRFELVITITAPQISQEFRDFFYPGTETVTNDMNLDESRFVLLWRVPSKTIVYTQQNK